MSLIPTLGRIDAKVPSLLPPVLVALLLLLAACGGGGGGGNPISKLTILEFSGVTLTPAFSPDQLAYTGAVASTVSAVTLTANTSAADARVAVNGTELGSGSVARVLPLVEGDNVYDVTVMAANASASTNYEVTITRAAPPRLLGLEVSGGALSPAFAATTTAYSTAVAFLRRQVTVTASTDVQGATIEIDGLPATNGQASAPITLDEGGNDIVVRVTTPDGNQRDYTLTVTRATVSALVERLDQPGRFAGDEFGSCVAIDGDTIAIGAPLANGAAADTGAVTILRNSGGFWLEEAFLTGPTASAGAGSDLSLALEGDVLVVGFPAVDQAFVYTRSGSTWTASAALTPTGLDPAGFGAAVAISGGAIAVAAALDDAMVGSSLVVDAGAVYVFTGGGSTWTQQARLTASNPGQDDFFGVDVDLEGDVLVVGARNEDSTSTGINSIPNENGWEIGAVYVFRRSGSNWTQEAYVKPGNTAAARFFGVSVDLSGDRMAIGAGESSVLGVASGEVFVFDRSGGTWSESARFSGNNTGSFDGFGRRVALQGDVLAVGARSESSGTPGTNPPQDDNAPDSGAVYVFVRTATGWEQRAFLKASTTSEQDNFGSDVALSGDTLVVGARLEDVPGTNCGHGFVFR